MENWFIDKAETKRKTLNAIMDEMDYLLIGVSESACCWIDPTHNVYAFINDNGDDDKWVEVRYELYEPGEGGECGEFVGDIETLSTDTTDYEELREVMKTIVNMYYGDWEKEEI